MASEDPIIRLESVSKIYGAGPRGRKGNGTDATAALSCVSLELRRGEALAITGPSGAGKSTLLSIMGTLEEPSSGKLFIDGRSVDGLGRGALSKIRRERLGFVFQEHRLVDYLSVLENVLLPLWAAPLSRPRKDAGTAWARHLMDRVGLAGMAHKRPAELSGGERQRAAVARALALRPAAILADEPTGALDSANAENLIELLFGLNREEGVALAVVTHSENLAARFSRRIALLDGRIS
jgi:ABC-type lipoprotein export system ATPase subunit